MALGLAGGGEWVRKWVGPFVTVVTVVIGGIGSYYTVQARIFQEIERVGVRSTELLRQQEMQVGQAQSQLRETLVGLDLAVHGLTDAVKELKLAHRETARLLDETRRDVVRLEAQEEMGRVQLRR